MLRDKANAWHVEKKRLVEESQSEFAAGNHAIAKELNEKVKEAIEQMGRANEHVRDAIYHFNNNTNGKNPFFIDLHGLYIVRRGGVILLSKKITRLLSF